MPTYTLEELLLAAFFGMLIGFAISFASVWLAKSESDPLAKSGFPDGEREFKPTISTRLFSGRAK